ncbi:hypothetical protein GWK08_15945 [Leptobacterium flavescens]|uniref:DUF3278 domain-containing protein n=1 Tax=Leptobacterium flavescens TaxID=472055 RepID=A0A6P0USZ9_9FLAO|nr:hypothetical protein [Leptobacterium flavescens]NER14949.1 hypothetical protein [Leptobacterium flavescens]
MKTFEEIESLWNQQGGGKAQAPEEFIEKARKVKKKVIREHLWTQAILAVTVLVLVVFFVSVSVANFNQSLLGASLMAGTLVIRILMEAVSKARFAKLDETENFRSYTSKAVTFYNWRKKVHFVATPVLIGLYATGFILLLPYFKKGVSTGFYNYIIFSGIAFLVFFCILIYRQIRKELEMLKYLKGSEGEG